MKALKNNKYILPVGGAALLALLLFRGKERIPTLPPIKPPPIIPPSQKNTYTYSAQQYSDFSKALFNAMYNWGTDEKALKTVFSKMVTFADVIALIDAYGSRKLRTAFGWDSKPMTLAEALTDELDESDLQEYVNTPLKRTGYKF